MTKQIQEAFIVDTTHATANKLRGMFHDIRPGDLALLGISWNSGKVVGLPQGELMKCGVSVADWVVEGRR